MPSRSQGRRSPGSSRARQSGRARKGTLGALAIISAVVAVGCGARGGPGDYLGLSAPPGTELPAAGAARGAGTPSGVPAVGVPTTAPAGNAAAFCQDVQEFLTLFPRLLSLSGQTETVADIKALDNHFEKDAPADIRPDVHLVVRTNRRIVADLTAQPVALGDLAQAFADPGYQLAVQQVGSYGFSYCGG